GNFSFSIRVTDSASTPQNASQAFSGNIVAAPSVLCVPSTATGEVGVLYSTSCSVTGGTAPYTWSVATGALPSGVNLNSAGTTATASGPPTVAGVFSFSLRVTDAPSQSATSPVFSGTIIAAPSLVCIPNSGPVQVGVAYTTTCSVSGGTAPYTFS